MIKTDAYITGMRIQDGVTVVDGPARMIDATLRIQFGADEDAREALLQAKVDVFDFRPAPPSKTKQDALSLAIAGVATKPEAYVLGVANCKPVVVDVVAQYTPQEVEILSRIVQRTWDFANLERTDPKTNLKVGSRLGRLRKDAPKVAVEIEKKSDLGLN